jgi:hypothetical protein
MKFKGSSAQARLDAALPATDRVKPYLPYLLLGAGILALSGVLGEDLSRTRKKRTKRRKKR